MRARFLLQSHLSFGGWLLAPCLLVSQARAQDEPVREVDDAESQEQPEASDDVDDAAASDDEDASTEEESEGGSESPAAAEEPEPVAPASGDDAPQPAIQIRHPAVIEEVPAVYPAGGKGDARVELAVTLNAQGELTAVSVTRSAGADFDAQALAAVALWKFSPAFRGEQPVAAKIGVALEFREEKPEEVPTSPVVEAEELGNTGDKGPPPSQAEAHVHSPEDRHLEVTVHGERELRTSQRSASDYFIHREVLESAPRAEGVSALSAVPGLTLARVEGPAVAHTYNLRGFDADHGQDIEFKVGGLPVNLPSHIHGQGYADLNFLIGEIVDELHVSEGVSDPAQGDFAVAGSVEVGLGVDDEHRGLQVRSSYGSFNTFQQSVVWAPKESERENVGAAYYSSTDGFGENRKGKTGSAIVQHRFGEGELTYRAIALIHAARSEQAGLLRRDDVESGRECLHCVYPYATAEAQNSSAGRFMAGVFADYRGANHSSGSFGLWAGYDQFRTQFNATGFLEQSQSLPDVYGRGDLVEQRNQTGSMGLTGRYRTEAFEPSSWAHGTVEVGADGRFDQIGQKQDLIDANVHNQVWDNRVEADISALQIGIWGDLDWQFGSRVEARAGIRGALVSYEVVDALGNRAPSSRPQDSSLPGYTRTSLGTTVGPRTSLEVKATEALSVLGSYGEGYRTPQARSLEDGEEAPFSKVRSADLGLRLRHRNLWNLSLVGYLTSMSEDFAFDPTEGGLSRLGPTLRTGATFYATTRPTHWLLSTLSVTYVHATLQDPPPAIPENPDPPFVEGELVPYVPPLVLRFEASTKNTLVEKAGSYALIGKTGLGFTYRAAQPLPGGGRGDAWPLLDASAGLLWGPFDLSVAGYNLMNFDFAAEEYVFTSDWEPDQPTTRVPASHVVAGAPLSVMATLGVTL